ncbi:response regulator [uncultured Sphaerochaeta sp.]|uniref:response regulator transcription factor n=1 Tax=uncultured Sphaerochaeta sp. TaxID=886478 RepID=UPI002A0A4BAF|nr:response regulator [uncultured Sphaerochaeta sp.]
MDDDELIRKGIEKVIPWDTLGFTVVETFSSAIEALNFLKTKDVDVILTDVKMPIMSGLDLIQEAKRLNPKCRAVIISGFGEFELVKSALTLKAEDYLLKPLSQNDIETVFRKVAKTLESDSQSQISDNSINNCYELVKKLSGEFALWDEYISGDTVDSKYKLCLIQYETLVNINNDLEKALNGMHYALKNDFVTFLATENEFNLRLEIVKKLFEATSKSTYKIMIGSEVFWVDDIIPSFWSAFDLLSETKENGISYYSDMHNEEPLKIIQYVRKTLIEKIEAGNKADLDDALHELIKMIKTLKLKEQGYVYCAIIIKVVRYFSLEDSSNGFQSPRLSIRNADSQELEERFINDIEFLTKTLNSKSDSHNKLLILKTQHIIRQRFNDLELSLSQIADELGISYGYLSTIFTKIVGRSFKTYLVDIRMEEARTLLLSRKYRIYEISEKVGYTNPKYFTEAFHKYYGSAPGEYLQNLHTQE